MTTVLLILHLMIASALVGVVLLQRSEGGGLGIGGGGGFMTGRGAANFLTRVTAGLAAAFFATSMLLTLLATRYEQPRSIFDTPAASVPAKGEPSDKAAPAAPGDAGQPAQPGQAPRGGLLDKLGPPTAPGGPRVPQSQ
jgi:preprotein translocase subunit SecG